MVRQAAAIDAGADRGGITARALDRARALSDGLWLRDRVGPAESDNAILDALLRGVGVNFFDGMAGNIADIDARLSPDLRDNDVARFLGPRRRLERVAIRHTVGLDDKIEGRGGVADPEEN